METRAFTGIKQPHILQNLRLVNLGHSSQISNLSL